MMDAQMNNASLIRYAIRNIRPNPFRNLQRYPIQREKVDALRESLRATEYWPNIVARRIDGGAEIAYGHHRIEAVRQEFSDDYEIGLVIRDLSDETMFQMMARENREEWSTGFDFEIELVRATVEAFAAGRLQLGLPDERTPHAALRLAPSFKCGADVSPAAWNRSYTAASIAGYLRLTKSNGDAQDKVHHALSALELIELGLAQQTDFAGLSIKGAGELISKARQARAIAGRRAESARKEAEYRKGKAADAIEKKQMAEADLRKQTQRLAEAQTELDKYNAERDAKDAARRIKQAEITRQLAQEDAYNAGVKKQEQQKKTRTAPPP